MLDMYVKCRSIEEAKRLFDRMPEKDIVSWTTMLDGYAQSGNYDEAWRVFAAMPSQNIAVWNVLISSCEQSGKPKDSLAVFHDCIKGRARNLTKSLYQMEPVYGNGKGRDALDCFSRMLETKVKPNSVTLTNVL